MLADVQELGFHITEEFLEHCADGALSVEVWGNRSSGFSALPNWQMDQMRAKSCSIADRWVNSPLVVLSVFLLVN